VVVLQRGLKDRGGAVVLIGSGRDRRTIAPRFEQGHALRGGSGPLSTGIPTTLFVLAARSGDRAAFEQLVRDAYDRLYALARRIVTDPSDAEDVTQETLLRAWRDLPGLREPERFEAWLTRMLVHTSYDHLRRRRRRPATVPWIVPGPVAPEGIGLEERERLGLAFQRLSPEHRAVLALHFYRDLTAAEIAALLGVPEGTVNSRLFYGTRALRAALEAVDRAHPAGRERSA
jgi:RNA polymerase sigma-70 factor (ECF subfamily)